MMVYKSLNSSINGKRQSIKTIATIFINEYTVLKYVNCEIKNIKCLWGEGVKQLSFYM